MNVAPLVPRRRRLAFLVAALAPLLACGHDAPPPRAAAPDVKNERACTAAQRQTTSVIEGWASAVGRSAEGPAFEAIRAAVACPAQDTSPWALALQSLRGSPEDLSGRWVLVYVEPNATRPFAPRTDVPAGGEGLEGEAPDTNLLWNASKHVMPESILAFDYDGDGVPEAIPIARTTFVSRAGVESSVRRGRVFAYRGGTLAAYPGAAAFAAESAQDVDGDGRPDLVTRGPYAAIVRTACGDDLYPVIGPALLAHARSDGTFSTSDEVAVSFARRECPKEPSPVMVPNARRTGFVDEPSSAKNLLCAHFWGATPAVVGRAVSDACIMQGVCAACDDPALLQAWGTGAPSAGAPASAAFGAIQLR